MLFQQGLRNQEVVAVAVVECEHHGVRQRFLLGQRAPKFAERDDAVTVAKQLHLVGEAIRGDAELPGVGSSP